MKTKTGQFLMQQNKSKMLYQVPVSQSKSERAEILTPRKEQKITSKQISKGKIKNKQGQQSEKETRPYQKSNEIEISSLRKQNKALCEEIERLKKQCASLKSTVDEKSHKNQRNFLSEQKQNIDSTKNQLAIKRLSQISQQQQQQQFIVMDQKLRNLQVQNYRLIQSNYVLLIRFRKSMKQFKDSLIKISNLLENLQFAEASRQIYSILGRTKGDEGWVEGEIGEIKYVEKQGKNLERQKEQQREKQQTLKSQIDKLKKPNNLSLISSTCHFTHTPHPTSQIDLQNNIQLSLRHISPSYHHHQPNSLQFIERPLPKSTLQFPSKKLFSFELNDPEFIEKSPSEKGLTEWENGHGNGSVIKRTIYKCHGNSNQLYKMLFLQAAAIESFFS